MGIYLSIIISLLIWIWCKLKLSEEVKATWKSMHLRIFFLCTTFLCWKWGSADDLVFLYFFFSPHLSRKQYIYYYLLRLLGPKHLHDNGRDHATAAAETRPRLQCYPWNETVFSTRWRVLRTTFLCWFVSFVNRNSSAKLDSPALRRVKHQYGGAASGELNVKMRWKHEQ